LLPTETYISQGAYGMAVATWMVPADLMAAGSMALSVESALTFAMLNVAAAELAPALGLALALAAPFDVELDPQAARTTASRATTTLAATSDTLFVFLMTLPLVMAAIIEIVKAVREVYEITLGDDTAAATRPEVLKYCCAGHEKRRPRRPSHGRRGHWERSWQSR
jgi:hypothetical protein